jgi:hypothetical protein
MRAAVLADLTPDTFGYRLLFLLHLTCVVVGFGSSFVYPILGVEGRRRGGAPAQALSQSTLLAAGRLTTPVIYLAGGFGLILAIVSPFDMGSAWIAIGLLVFLAAVLFAGFVHVPNLKAMDRLLGEVVAADPAAGGPPPQAAELDARGKKAAMYGGILHLAFLVLMIDMIWKPGA